MPRFRVEPWFNGEEWEHVRDLVLNRDLRALRFLKVWESRSARLAAGVETTICLLQASTQMSSSLSLSMAINRFLNHISHIGMNVFGVTKLHQAAERLKVPSWIVDIRHDSTHGHMPSLTILRNGFEACWSWIITNYWLNKEVHQPKFVETPELKLARLLDCYMYLKLYQIWGTPHIKDIAGNEEVFLHIDSSWKVGRGKNGGSSLLSMSVKQAVVMLRNEILAVEAAPETLATVLVDNDLLVPDSNFMASMHNEEETEEDHVELPRDLLLIWKDFIERIDDKVGAKVLLDALVERICKEDDEGEEAADRREYCAAWVVELSEALFGRSDLLKLKSVQCGTEDLEAWISRPNPLLQMLLPCFFELVSVDKGRRELLEAVVAAMLGDHEDTLTAKQGEEGPVYTVEDLDPAQEDEVREAEKRTQQKVTKGWEREKRWAGEQLVKTVPLQLWSSLWLPESAAWTEPSCDTAAEEVSTPEMFEMERVVWPGEADLRQNGHHCPAFYRPNKHTFSSPRRKRTKRM